MSPDLAVAAIVAHLRRYRELDGCVIGYQGRGICRILDSGTGSRTPRSPCCAVIIEEVELGSQGTEELAKASLDPNGLRGNHNQPEIVRNASRIGPELIGAGVSCGLAVVAAWGVVGGVAAEIPTGGVSTFLVVASWTGLVTGGIQCLNGLVRVGAIFPAPKATTLTQWDSNLTCA